jgi:FkbM family methyltransferase
MNQHIIAKNCAISHRTEVIDFLEFPVLFSEFNTLEKEIYADEEWFKKNPSNRIKINAITGTNLLQELQLHPTIIKIDVEGAEEKVIIGLVTYLKQHHPKIIMEFANSKRNNTNHSKAEAILFSIGYKAYSISNTGEPVPLSVSTSDYIAEQQLESDNIIYLKDL